MLGHHEQYATDFMRAKAAAFGDLAAVQPDLDRRLAPVDVDVRRLVRLVTVEIEAEAVQAEKGWHVVSFFPRPMRRQSCSRSP